MKDDQAKIVLDGPKVTPLLVSLIKDCQRFLGHRLTLVPHSKSWIKSILPFYAAKDSRRSVYGCLRILFTQKNY